jgi:hypothetical protein
MSQVVIGDILPRTQAIATLSQTVFGTNWTANAASDVVVYQTPAGEDANDISNVLSYPSEYSVAFIGGAEDVQVTLVTGAGAGDIVTVTRQTPADRENLYTNTNFTPSMLNNDFGILTLVDQQAQLVDQLVGPRYNYSAIINPLNLDEDTILPILGANQVWAKNSGNTAIVAIDVNTSGGISGTINVGLQNELAYYAANGNTISGLATGNNGVLVTSGAGVPSISTTLPNAINLGAAIFPSLQAQSNGSIIYGSDGAAVLALFISGGTSVNLIEVASASTGNHPFIQGIGSDTNVTLDLKGQGTGGVAVHGTGTNSDAAAGFVGEVISSVIPFASAVSFTNVTARDVTSISVTAGNWIVYGNVTFTAASGTQQLAWCSLTSATIPDVSLISEITAGGSQGMTTPILRVKVTTTTTVYLSGYSAFSAGTSVGCGGIYAIRAL